MPFQAVKDTRRGSTDRRQKPASSAAPTDTALRLFQSRPCYLSPTEQQRISRAPPLQPRRGPHVIPAAAASAPAAARTRQREQADKRRRAISLRLPCRFGGGQGYIPQKAGWESICRFCSAMPPFQKQPCGHPPADPAERRHKKDRTSTAARSCIGFLWLALRSPRPAGDGGLRPLSGSGNPKAAKRRSLAAFPFTSKNSAPNARRAKSFFDRRRTAA